MQEISARKRGKAQMSLQNSLLANSLWTIEYEMLSQEYKSIQATDLTFSYSLLRSLPLSYQPSEVKPSHLLVIRFKP